MMCGDIEVPGSHQMIANSTHHLGVIAIAQFWRQNSNRLRFAIAERTSEEAGTIVKLLCGRLDAVASYLWDGAARHVVQDNRNGRGIQAEVLRQLFESYRPIVGGRVFQHAIVCSERIVGDGVLPSVCIPEHRPYSKAWGRSFKAAVTQVPMLFQSLSMDATPSLR